MVVVIFVICFLNCCGVCKVCIYVFVFLFIGSKGRCGYKDVIYCFSGVGIVLSLVLFRFVCGVLCVECFINCFKMFFSLIVGNWLVLLIK